MRTTQLSLVSLAIHAALALGAPIARAEEPAETASPARQTANNNAQKPAEKEAERVEVRGIRDSLKDNLGRKRDANSVMDAVNSEDAAKNADKNVAEALQRVPGVQIVRDFGEGERISIRGTDPSFTNTLVNGQSVQTAEWRPGVAESNAFNFSVMPAELVARMEVHKSPQADLNEGGLGGTVILHTKKPLEVAAGTSYLSLEDQYSETAKNHEPQITGSYYWHNDAGNLGFMVNAVAQNRDVRREGYEAFLGQTDREVVNGSNTACAAAQTGTSACSRIASPDLIGSALFSQKRERRGLNASAQWRPSDKLDVLLEYFNSSSGMDNYNRNLFAWMHYWRALSTATVVNDDVAGSVRSIRIPGNLAAIGAASDRNVWYETLFRPGSETNSESANFTINWNGDKFDIKGVVGESVGDSYQSNHQNGLHLNESAAGQATLSKYSFAYDAVPGGVPTWDVGSWITNPTNEMVLNDVFKDYTLTENSERYGQMDVTWHTDMGILESLKFGGKLRDREHFKNRYFSTFSFGTVNGAADWHPASEFWDGALLSGLHTQISPIASSYFLTDQGKLENYWQSAKEVQYDYRNSDNQSVRGLCTAQYGATATCRSNYAWFPTSNYRANEDIFSYYLKANIKGDGYRGNIGVRIVESDNDTTRFRRVKDPSSTLPSADRPFLISEYLQQTSYTDVLPSMNLSVDVMDKVKARFAASKAIANPTVGQLATPDSYTTGFITGSGGNPGLQSQESEQFDAGLEWYYSDKSFAALTFFGKSIRNFITTYSQLELIDVPDDLLDAELPILMSRPRNAEGGKMDVSGYELQVQHQFDAGFGGLMNYTYTDIPDFQISYANWIRDPNNPDNLIPNPTTPTGSATVKMPGNSKNTGNLQLYYENEKYSARLAYNFRSEYFISASAQGQRFRDAYGQLDAKFTYNFSKDVVGTFSVMNLTDEIEKNFIRANVSNPGQAREDLYFQWYETGRRVFMGVNIRL